MCEDGSVPEWKEGKEDNKLGGYCSGLLGEEHPPQLSRRNNQHL